jgi:hypothetical protein
LREGELDAVVAPPWVGVGALVGVDDGDDRGAGDVGVDLGLGQAVLLDVGDER